MPGYPQPEVWPDDDTHVEPTKDELALAELDGAELADYIAKKKGRRTW